MRAYWVLVESVVLVIVMVGAAAAIARRYLSKGWFWLPVAVLLVSAVALVLLARRGGSPGAWAGLCVGVTSVGVWLSEDFAAGRRALSRLEIKCALLQRVAVGAGASAAAVLWISLAAHDASSPGAGATVVLLVIGAGALASAGVWGWRLRRAHDAATVA